jgi:type III secretion protein L
MPELARLQETVSDTAEPRSGADARDTDRVLRAAACYGERVRTAAHWAHPSWLAEPLGVDEVVAARLQQALRRGQDDDVAACSGALLLHWQVGPPPLSALVASGSPSVLASAALLCLVAPETRLRMLCMRALLDHVDTLRRMIDRPARERLSRAIGVPLADFVARAGRGSRRARDRWPRGARGRARRAAAVRRICAAPQPRVAGRCSRAGSRRRRRYHARRALGGAAARFLSGVVMAIWLRRATVDNAGDVAATAAIVPARTVAAMVRLDEGYRQLEADRAMLLAQARAEAYEIIAAARAQAADIAATARRQHSDAHQQGYESGRAAALADWYDSAAAAAEVHRRLQDRMRERFAELVMVAAEQVISAESRAALFVRATSAVESIVERATYLRINVHPDDLAHAEAEFEALAQRRREAGSPLPLTVVADRRLAAGSCLCETDIGTADASLATQLRAMRLAVDRALASASAVDAVPAATAPTSGTAHEAGFEFDEDDEVGDLGDAGDAGDALDSDVDAWMRELGRETSGVMDDTDPLSDATGGGRDAHDR